MFVLLHKIGRAAHPERAGVEHMRVDHGGLHVLVAQQLLNGADAPPPLQIQPQLNHPLTCLRLRLRPHPTLPPPPPTARTHSRTPRAMPLHDGV